PDSIHWSPPRETEHTILLDPISSNAGATPAVFSPQAVWRAHMLQPPYSGLEGGTKKLSLRRDTCLREVRDENSKSLEVIVADAPYYRPVDRLRGAGQRRDRGGSGATGGGHDGQFLGARGGHRQEGRDAHGQSQHAGGEGPRARDRQIDDRGGKRRGHDLR